MKEMSAAYKALDATLGQLVADLIEFYGIPTGLEDVEQLAALLYVDIMGERANLAAAESDLIVEEFPTLAVAQPSAYKVPATNKIVRKAAGLTPTSKVPYLDSMDSKTKKLTAIKMAPWTMPEDPLAVDTFKKRLTASGSRHAKSASRSVVLNTARKNNVMWARQLSGAENCAFCAMLASRGADYNSRGSASFRTHNHCDCTATIVMDSNSGWDGKEESEELSELWKQSDGLAGFRENLRKRAA